MSHDKLFCGEDIITLRCNADMDVQQLASRLREADCWAEVVPGMADITVKYDPDVLAAAAALRLFEQQLSNGPHGEDSKAATSLCLTARFDGKFAPDAAIVAEAIGITIQALPDWLSQRQFRVEMMGFQPGFAYLQDMDSDCLPVIARLARPRQNVAAGSIGFLGGKACIYALAGPGGWPIIGRVDELLFDAEKPNPVLLSPGQIVRFSNGD